MRNTLRRGGSHRDLLCNGMSGFLFWCLPWFAFALGWTVSPIWRTVLWTASLGVMGALCLLNVSQCGRVHCYFTGPLFILGAVFSLGIRSWTFAVCSVWMEMDLLGDGYWRHRLHLHSITHSRSL